MIKTFQTLVVFLLLFQSLFLHSQGLELETVPASVKWSQINTPNFDVIFQNGFEKEANRTANILESIHEPASQSLGVKPRKFSIILQNQNAIANGFVTIGPRRSEFYTTSRQDYRFIGNTDWLEFLAVHEYRHMVQFEKAYRSPINKLMYVGFGEYGVGFAAGIAAPSWFWEGDAVGIETAFTRTGRGRTPNFDRVFKANLMEKGGFDYNKQHLTSFKDFVPNHYRTGFFMTTHLKRKHGNDIWDKIVRRSFSFPFLPFAFSNAIKKETGNNLLQTYDNMISEMRGLYGEQIKTVKPNKASTVNKRVNRTFTNYEYPSFADGDNILALKSGFSDIDKFILLDEKGNESNVFTTGIINDPGFISSNASKVTWTEFEFDPRWLKKTYSVIKVLDLKTKEFLRLTKKSKYVSAALSPDGNQIVAINNSENNIYALEILDAKSGSVQRSFENASNKFLSMARFSTDGNSLVFLRSIDSGKQLVKLDLETELEEVLLESEYENFGHPILTPEYLYYGSPVNGIDNIYALNLSSKEVFQLTDSKYGAYNPAISKDGSELVYNEFNKDGMDILRLRLNRDNWTPINSIVDRNLDFVDQIIEDEGHQHVLEEVEIVNYETRPYKKIKHTIRPHSWGVSAIPTNTSLIVGVNSQDVLSTTAISAGFQFDSDERNWLRFAGISYQGLYPIIDLSIVDGDRSADVTVESTRQTFNWKETTLSAGLRVPLILTNSKYLRKLTFSTKSEFTSVSNFDIPDNRVFIEQAGNGKLRALEHSISFTSRLRTSKLDLNSRFGQSFSIDYKHTPLGGNYKSELFSVESDFFFPGLFRHHSLRLRGSFQHENSTNYFFDDEIRFTRGYSYIPFRYFTNWSVNYKMPLWYPDIHLGPLLNLQRVYVNGFYDHGVGKLRDSPNFNLKSYGAEVSFNFNLMRFLLLFDVGLRYSYRPDFNDQRVELIVGAVTL